MHKRRRAICRERRRMGGRWAPRWRGMGFKVAELLDPDRRALMIALQRQGWECRWCPRCWKNPIVVGDGIPSGRKGVWSKWRPPAFSTGPAEAPITKTGRHLCGFPTKHDRGDFRRGTAEAVLQTNVGMASSAPASINAA